VVHEDIAFSAGVDVHAQKLKVKKIVEKGALLLIALTDDSR